MVTGFLEPGRSSKIVELEVLCDCEGVEHVFRKMYSHSDTSHDLYQARARLDRWLMTVESF